MAAPAIQWYEATDTTLQTAAIASSQAAGSTVAAVVYHAWNDKGGSLGSTTVKNARLVAEGFDGTNWVRNGLPWLDEGWLLVSLTGQDNTGDATMVAQVTAFTPLGTNRTVLLNDIPKNCARYVSAKIIIPGGASTATPDIRLIVVYDETSTPLSYLSSYAEGEGIVPEYRIVTSRKLTSGGRITASGTAVVGITARNYAYDGVPYYLAADTQTLNQTSGSGALTAGQSYVAVISQAGFGSTTTTVTKGNGAASPTTPATPAGNIYIGKVTVAFQAGGTSIINSGNLDQTATIYGEYYMFAGTGLNLNIGSGMAITRSDTAPFNTGMSVLALTDNIVNFIWIVPDGTVTFNTSGASPSTASLRVGYAITAGGVITSIVYDTDNGFAVFRSERAINENTPALRYYGTLSVLAAMDWLPVPYDCFLEAVDVMIGTASSGGATGANVFDVTYDQTGAGPGTTIYTGTSPLSIAAGGIRLQSVKTHTQRIFFAGGRVAISCTTATTGGTPASDVMVTLHFRRANIQVNSPTLT